MQRRQRGFPRGLQGAETSYAHRPKTMSDCIKTLASCVELASCQFPPYFRAVRMPTLLLFIQRLTQRRFGSAIRAKPDAARTLNPKNYYPKNRL